MKIWTGSLLAIGLVSLVLAAAVPDASARTCCDKARRVAIRCDGNRLHGIGGDLEGWLEDTSGGWLGIRLQELTPGLREALDVKDREGILVSDVVEDSPAEKAGIKPGDIIFKIDDLNIDDSGSLVDYVRKLDPGDKVRIHFLRDGKKKSETVKLEQRDVDVHKILSAGKGEPWVTAFNVSGRPRIGVVVQPMDEDLASYFDVKEDEGVLVVRVVEDSPAEEAGLKGGDVIVEVADEKVESAEDIREAVGDFEAGDEVAVRVVRKGDTKTFKVTLDENPKSWFSNNLREMPNLKSLPHIPDIEEHMFMLQDLEGENLEEELDQIRKEIRSLRRELKELKERRS